MAANKKKKNEEKTEPAEEALELNVDGKTETPERPASGRADLPPEDSLIDEWDVEHLQSFDRLPDEEGVEPAASVPGGIHPEDYRRISVEEFDEFDLMDEDSRPMARIDEEIPPDPQLKLLEEDEFDEIERIFEDNPPDDAGETTLEDEAPAEQPAIDQEEAPMDIKETPKETNTQPPPPEIEEPPPHFEDRGMGASFFVAEDELQPTQEELPEAESPPPAPEQPDDKEEEPQTVFAADIFFPPGPTMEIHMAPEAVGDLPADNGLVEKEITDDRVSKLMYRAEMARRRINDEIDSIELARELLELIRSSTTLILSGKDKYEEAERSLNEVEFRLSYARRVKVWSDKIAYRLLSYEVFWLIVLGLGALFIPSVLSAMILRLNEVSPNSLPDFIMMDDLFLGVSTALWGGLGGVVGAMYSLWRHVSLKQDFNPQHKMWYFTQPIMGIPIGIVIFLIVRIGIGFTVEGVLDFASPYAIYMMAWIAGFQQNILYEIIRQILKLFRIQN